MKIVIDKAIPFIEGVFEPYFSEILYKEGKEICNADVLDADALVIRTRTKCDKRLLRGSKVKIIATATIGTDHIDFDYCRRHGIYVENASGCNAGGVMDYVFSAVYVMAARKTIDLTDARFGVIGVGSVGSRVADMAEHLGFKVYRCDPPRAQVEGPEGFCSLDELLANCQIVTMHVPLNKRTRRMAGKNFFKKMRPGAFFINASRGEVVNDKALLKAIPKLGPVIIDTWNKEPDVNLELLEKVDIATPHVAGYSYQGKQNGTSMAVRAVARFFALSDLYDFFPPTEEKEHEAVKLDVSGMSQGQIASTFQYNYPILTDDFMFRLNPDKFEEIRTNYRYRTEFSLI